MLPNCFVVLLHFIFFMLCHIVIALILWFRIYAKDFPAGSKRDAEDRIAPRNVDADDSDVDDKSDDERLLNKHAILLLTLSSTCSHFSLMWFDQLICQFCYYIFIFNLLFFFFCIC